MRLRIAIAPVLGGAILALGTAAWAQQQTFKLGPGQAMRIAPDGQVSIFTRMQGDPGHIAEMERRAHPMPNGLAVWIGPDGTPRYLTDPVEDPAHPHR
jgi:hypothetical protein